MENYYQVLGVAPDATADEIKSRYRFLVKAYHPDRFTDQETKAMADDEMKRINAAYTVLSDPEKRKLYDLKSGRGQESSRQPAGPAAKEEPVSKQTAAAPKQQEPPQPQQARTTATKEVEFCQSCRQTRPTKKVIFHQNIGLIFLRFHRKIEGQLCADCVEKHFWQMTGITLLLGWWGIISFFATPFIFVINFVNYYRARELRKTSNNLGNIALGWKALITLLIGVIAFLIFTWFSNNPPAIVADVSTNQSEKPSVSQSLKPTATKERWNLAASKGKATSPQPDCFLWNEITASDKGRSRCVYGEVRKAYWGGETFYMSFSEDPNAFRLIVLDGYYFKGVEGQCVMAEGVVKTYDKLPYIEVGENLWNCN